MAEGNSTPETPPKGLRNFIDRAKQIRNIRNRGNKDAVLRAKIELEKEEGEVDILTGLPNRRGYERRMRDEIERLRRTGEKATVMMLDLDKLKAVNDTQGHAAGDEYLKKAAETFKNGLRHMDFIARLGGDEFAAILPGTDTKQVWNIWEGRLKPLTLRNNIMVSAGASELNPDSPQASIDEADKALYGAKKDKRKNGNNLYVKQTQA